MWELHSSKRKLKWIQWTEKWDSISTSQSSNMLLALKGMALHIATWLHSLLLWITGHRYRPEVNLNSIYIYTVHTASEVSGRGKWRALRNERSYLRTIKWPVHITVWYNWYIIAHKSTVTRPIHTCWGSLPFDVIIHFRCTAFKVQSSWLNIPVN